MELSVTIPQSDDEGWPYAPEVLGNRFLLQFQVFKDCIWIFAAPSTALQARMLNQSAGLGCLLCAALPRLADDLFCACLHAGKVKPGCECYPIQKRSARQEKRARSGSSCFRVWKGLFQDSAFCSLPVLLNSSHSCRLCSALLL